jgi:hypothetical protein
MTVRQPNIVFIMTDQHHADYLGCLGRRELRTPHLDALAAQSAVFSAAYTASPICDTASKLGWRPGAQGKWVEEKNYVRRAQAKESPAGLSAA